MSDLDTKVYIAGFRALGIFNKLISGPVYKKVKEKNHIFSLNPMWNELQVVLDRCSKDASEMFSGTTLLGNVELSKDPIFDALFSQTNDPEFDLLTQECLEMICCCCVSMINRQLKDQLPGGKYYQPTADIMDETGICHTTNILSERDFAQMDRKVNQKQNISTIGASGVIMFMNNKTGKWLSEKDGEDQEKLVSLVRKLTPQRVDAYRKKRRDLLKARQDMMERKKLDNEIRIQKKSDEKEKLTKKVEEFGGLWKNVEEVDIHLSKLPSKQHKTAIIAQIDFRKAVLDQVPPDRTVGQKGRTVDGKRVEFSCQELKANLKKFIDFQALTAEIRAKTVLSQVEVRPREERREKLEEAKKEIASKQQSKADRIDNSEAERVEPKKKKYPKLFGKKIKHKWTLDNGKDVWYTGIVTAVLDDDEYDSDCEFKVCYDEYPEETYDLPLIKDYKRNWVVIIGNANLDSDRIINQESTLTTANDNISTQENSPQARSSNPFQIIQSIRVETPKTRHSKRKRKSMDFKKLLTDLPDCDSDSDSEVDEKKERPLFFGKRISHKWEIKKGKEKWYNGTVTEVLGSDDERSSDCEFSVKYDGFSDLFTVALIDDWKKGWVNIIKDKTQPKVCRPPKRKAVKK